MLVIDATNNLRSTKLASLCKGFKDSRSTRAAKLNTGMSEGTKQTFTFSHFFDTELIVLVAKWA